MSAEIVNDYNVSALVAAISGEDINGMDSSEYIRTRRYVFAVTTVQERAIFFATGEIPERFQPVRTIAETIANFLKDGK